MQPKNESLREAWANGHERGQRYIDTGVCAHCADTFGPDVCQDCGEAPRQHADGTPRMPYQHRYGPTSHEYRAS